MDNTRIKSFAAAGEGVVLFFRNRDMLTLRNEFGPDYSNEIENGLLRMDAKIIAFMLPLAAEKGEKKINLKFEDCDQVSVEALQEALLDAFTLSMTGRTYQEQIRFLGARLEEAMKDKVPPPKVPEVLSAASSEPPSGQESPKPTS